MTIAKALPASFLLLAVLQNYSDLQLAAASHISRTLVSLVQRITCMCTLFSSISPTQDKHVGTAVAAAGDSFCCFSFTAYIYSDCARVLPAKKYFFAASDSIFIAFVSALHITSIFYAL